MQWQFTGRERFIAMIAIVDQELDPDVDPDYGPVALVRTPLAGGTEGATLPTLELCWGGGDVADGAGGEMLSLGLNLVRPLFEGVLGGGLGRGRKRRGWGLGR